MYDVQEQTYSGLWTMQHIEYNFQSQRKTHPQPYTSDSSHEQRRDFGPSLLGLLDLCFTLHVTMCLAQCRDQPFTLTHS